MERVKGIEPSSQPWEGHILPLNHTRFRLTHVYQINPPYATAFATFIQRSEFDVEC